MFCRASAYDENGLVDGVLIFDDHNVIHASPAWWKLHIDDYDLNTVHFMCMGCRHYVISRTKYAVISLSIIFLLIILF